MKSFVCEKCGYSTDHKGDYNKHLNKKRPCVEVLTENTDPIVVDEVIEQSNVNIKDYKLKYKCVKQERDDLKSELVKLKFEYEKLNLKLEHQAEIIELLKNQKSVQPIIEEQPKQVLKTNRFNETKLKIETEFVNAMPLNVAIKELEYSVSDVNTICRGEGVDDDLKFSNGVANCLVSKLKKYYKSNMPLLCSDTHRKVLHFKQQKYKLEKIEDRRITRRELINDYGGNPDEYERDENGLFIIYKNVKVLETDAEGNFINENIKEDAASEYVNLYEIINDFMFKVRKALPNGYVLQSDDNQEKLVVLNKSVKDNISKIASRMCKSLYVVDEVE